MICELPDDVVEAYAFANTPAYLYRRLAATDYVLELSKLDTDRLRAIVEDGFRGSSMPVLNAYAAFVAALRKADFEMTEDWEVAIECLEWGVAIRQIALQTVPVSQVHTYKLPKLQMINEIADPGIESSTSYIKGK